MTSGFTVCAGCGKSIFEYPIVLTRTSPKGEDFAGKCDECLGYGENPVKRDDAVVSAIKRDFPKE